MEVERTHTASSGFNEVVTSDDILLKIFDCVANSDAHKHEHKDGLSPLSLYTLHTICHRWARVLKSSPSLHLNLTETSPENNRERLGPLLSRIGHVSRLSFSLNGFDPLYLDMFSESKPQIETNVPPEHHLALLQHGFATRDDIDLDRDNLDLALASQGVSRITRVSLPWDWNVPYTAIQQIAVACPNLTHLKVRRMEAKTEVHPTIFCPNLEKLHIGYLETLASFDCPKLRALKVDFIYAPMKAVSELYPNLCKLQVMERFDLNYLVPLPGLVNLSCYLVECENPIEVRTIQMIQAHYPLLRKLNLWNNDTGTIPADPAVHTTLFDFPHLEYLNMATFFGVRSPRLHTLIYNSEPECMPANAHRIIAENNLNLTSLSLPAIREPSYPSEEIFRQCRLATLCLMDYVTLECLQSLSHVGNTLTKLVVRPTFGYLPSPPLALPVLPCVTELTLHGDQITLAHIVHACPNLKELQLFQKQTDADISAFCAHYGTQLTRLQLFMGTDPEGITDAALQAIAAHCTCLRMLWMDYNLEISMRTVNECIPRMKRLNSVRLGLKRWRSAELNIELKPLFGDLWDTGDEEEW